MYFKFYFIIANVDNLDTKLEAHFKLSFIIAKVDNSNTM